MPERVFSQVVDDAPEKPGAAQVRAADWLQLRRPRSDILEDVAQFLDPGEADTVAIAHEIESSVVVLDDQQARKIAEQRGLACIGTLGILIHAKESGLVQRLEPILKRLLASGFYLSATRFRRALERVGES